MEKEPEYEYSTYCPNCERHYDDIDIDYQICSKCGWDAEKHRINKKYKRLPCDDDYLSGEADILTGMWN